MSVLIVLYCLLTLAKCTTIEFSETSNKNFRTFEINSTDLSLATISEQTNAIRKVTYGINDQQLTHVRYLPELRNIYIENVKQQFLPIFFNLPNLENLSVERNELVFITRDRFSTTPAVYIFLRFNKILQIEDQAFGIKVKHVYLACNYLKTIRKEWFQNPALINVIDLDDNFIQHIEEDTFKDFKKLEYFYILHNGLKTIGDGAFSGSSFISEFWVGYNDLTQLQPQIFGNKNITIEILDISFNKLTFLDLDLMSKIHLTDNPKIDGNPWQCSCYLYHIIRWVPWKYYEHHKDRPGEPRCVSFPNDISRRCRTYVSNELIKIFMAASSSPPDKKGDFCKK